jgi:hypothetical protein
VRQRTVRDGPKPDTAGLALRMESRMGLSFGIEPLVALIAGILILVIPRLLNYIVAIYLILIGLLGLFGTGPHHLV